MQKVGWVAICALPLTGRRSLADWVADTESWRGAKRQRWRWRQVRVAVSAGPGQGRARVPIWAR